MLHCVLKSIFNKHFCWTRIKPDLLHSYCGPNSPVWKYINKNRKEFQIVLGLLQNSDCYPKSSRKSRFHVFLWRSLKKWCWPSPSEDLSAALTQTRRCHVKQQRGSDFSRRPLGCLHVRLTKPFSCTFDPIFSLSLIIQWIEKLYPLGCRFTLILTVINASILPQTTTLRGSFRNNWLL